jgi:repressor LexA
MDTQIQDTATSSGSAHVLTWRQRKILRVIRDSVQQRGYAPSMREIGDAVGLTSESSVSYQLSALSRKGYLQRDGRLPRTLEVRLPGRPASGQERAAPEAAYVPLVARFGADIPVLAAQQIEDVLPLPRKLVGDGPLFVLRVAGDSMINAAIADGDLAVVRHQQDADSGEIVAAMIDGEVTVRRLERSGDHTWLIPHNPSYLPLLGDDAVILGKVVAVLRSVLS